MQLVGFSVLHLYTKLQFSRTVLQLVVGCPTTALWRLYCISIFCSTTVQRLSPGNYSRWSSTILRWQNKITVLTTVIFAVLNFSYFWRAFWAKNWEFSEKSILTEWEWKVWRYSAMKEIKAESTDRQWNIGVDWGWILLRCCNHTSKNWF